MIKPILKTKNHDYFNTPQKKKYNQRPKLKILKRDLVYIIGLPKKISEERILRSEKFLGQYGTIKKLIINKENPYSSGHTPKPSYGVYVTYETNFEASLAVLALNKFFFSDYQIKASFGMTRYCNFFLRGKKCMKRECFYVHDVASPSDVFEMKRGSPMTKVGEVVKFIFGQKLELKNLLLKKDFLDDYNGGFPGLKFCLNKILQVGKAFQESQIFIENTKENMEIFEKKKTVKKTEKKNKKISLNKKTNIENIKNKYKQKEKKSEKTNGFSKWQIDILKKKKNNQFELNLKKNSFYSNTTEMNDSDFLSSQRESLNSLQYCDDRKILLEKVKEKMQEDCSSDIVKSLYKKILSCSINLSKRKSKYIFAQANSSEDINIPKYWNKIIDNLSDNNFSFENSQNLFDLCKKENRDDYELFNQSYNFTNL